VWRTSHGSCDLPSFKQDFLIPIASGGPVTLELSNPQQSATAFFPWLAEDADDHIAVLVLAWTYIYHLLDGQRSSLAYPALNKATPKLHGTFTPVLAKKLSIILMWWL
jgi:hypothetical protein